MKFSQSRYQKSCRPVLAGQDSFGENLQREPVGTEQNLQHVKAEMEQFSCHLDIEIGPMVNSKIF